MNKKIRVFIINNFPYPSLFPFFEELNEENSLLCKIFYVDESRDYPLSSIKKLKFDSDLLPGLLSPLKLFFRSFDVLIIDGWVNLACWISFFVCKLRGKPLILWVGSTESEKSWRRTIFLPLVKIILTNTTAFLAYGTKAKKYLLSLGVDKEKIFIAYNTVDIDFFQEQSDIWRKQKAKIKKELGIKDKKVILFMGRLIWEKGLEFLILAFKSLRPKIDNISLLIVGSGYKKQALENLIKKEKIEDVILTPGVRYTETPKYYSIADILILPSVSECWGLVVNEGMACGLPVLTSDKVGAGEDLIKHKENGFIFPAGNIKILSAYLEKILRSPFILKRMGERSLDLIRPFNNKNRIKSFLAAIHFCLSFKNV
jgi:glycosyltransferase involved in cell wall biosynthesis